MAQSVVTETAERGVAIERAAASAASIALDHIAFNGKYMQAEAAALFAQLGFQLTAPSVYSLGSVNQLIVFTDSYLEVIGLPASAVRPDLLAGKLGLDGLVLASEDIAATSATLAQAGFTLQLPQYFSRDIDFCGSKVKAEFAAVRLQPGQFDSARVYACQHLTPQYIWHPPWSVHANKVIGLAAMIFVAEEPAKLQAQYATLGNWRNFALQFTALSEWQADAWYPALTAEERAAILVFCAEDLALVQQFAERAGYGWRWHGRSLQIKLPVFDCVLQFEYAVSVAAVLG